MSSKISRLVALSDAEFGRKWAQPHTHNFEPKAIDVRKFGKEWDRLRGAAARMMAVVLREGSESLLVKVSADPQTAATFDEAIDWLSDEADLLRATAERHEEAVHRLRSTVCRYRAQQQEAAGKPALGAETSAPLNRGKAVPPPTITAAVPTPGVPNSSSVRMLSLKEVVARTGLSRSTIYKLQGEGRFPLRVKLTEKRSAWPEQEVEAYMERAMRKRAKDADG